MPGMQKLSPLRSLQWPLALSAAFFFVSCSSSSPNIVMHIPPKGEISLKCNADSAAQTIGANGRSLIVVGEYHRFGDIQRDVACIRRELIDHNPDIGFIGFDGDEYAYGRELKDKKMSRARHILASEKIPERVQVIGLEEDVGRWSSPGELATEENFKNLAAKKMREGLQGMEVARYGELSSRYYETAVSGRSKDWLRSIDDFMNRSGIRYGVIHVSAMHFPSLATELEHMGYSYFFFAPRSMAGYCNCEARFVKKRPDFGACNAVCNDPKIPAEWE